MLSIISGCTALGCTRAGPPLGIGVFYFFFGVGYFFGRLKGSIKKTADLRRVCLSVAVLGVRPPFRTQHLSSGDPCTNMVNGGGGEETLCTRLKNEGVVWTVA